DSSRDVDGSLKGAAGEAKAEGMEAPQGSCGKELGFWRFYTMRGLLEPSDQGIDGQI
ncbi:hypothetical protein BIFBRE_05121, partial [Bifidobacterium breve DSM 20213 = JCM 1192]